MPKSETLANRGIRLEQLHADLAEKVAILLDAQIKHEAESRERGRQIDERIANLVSAIGEFIRRNGTDPGKGD